MRIAVLAFAFTACGGVQNAQPMDEGNRLDPVRLFPMAEGNVWSYDVDTGEGIATLGISRVVLREGAQVEVSAGGTPRTYEIREDGIFWPSADAWLLREPIEEGATWPSASGRTARVTSVTARAEGPAGTFDGCVIVEENGEGGRQIVSTYCPDVGPVRVESSIVLGLSGRTERVTAVLRGFELLPAANPTH